MQNKEEQQIYQQIDSKQDFYEHGYGKKIIPKPFSQELEKEGHEFGELHEQREKFIRENIGKYKPQELEVPQNILGLTRRTNLTQNLPSTRRWWRRTTSFERNGFFNIHTHVLNTKMTYWAFLTILLWGFIQAPVAGIYQEKELDNYETREGIYDKLQGRNVPLVKIWSRPS